MTSQRTADRRVSAIDMTIGNELRTIVAFAVPLLLSNILQQCYSLTDVAIIGHELGDDALTAIGAVTTIVDLYNSLVIGMSNGFSVIIAKFYGAHDPAKLRQAVANTCFLAVIWGIVIMFAGIFTLNPMMKLLNTPETVYDAGYSYAIIMISLIGFSFLYNILSGLLRAIGNSKAPLYFLLVSVITNIALDLLFVVVLPYGLPGAAIATVMSQALSSFICLFYIVKKVPELHFRRKDMKLDRNMLGELFSAGFSFALMYSVVNVGTIVLQGAINGLGSAIIAAHTTARKISSLCMMVLSTLANSMATFAGQNHGAGRYDRIRRGLKQILIISMAVSTVEIITIYLAGGLLVRGISGSSNPEIINTAVFYLKFDLPFYYVLAIILITRATLQGMGSKIAPIAASIMELFLKIFTAGFLVRKFAYTGVAMCEPIIWTVCAVYILIVFFMNKNIRLSSSSLHADSTRS